METKEVQAEETFLSGILVGISACYVDDGGPILRPATLHDD